MPKETIKDIKQLRKAALRESSRHEEEDDQDGTIMEMRRSESGTLWSRFTSGNGSGNHSTIVATTIESTTTTTSPVAVEASENGSDDNNVDKKDDSDDAQTAFV